MSLMATESISKPPIGPNLSFSECLPKFNPKDIPDIIPSKRIIAVAIQCIIGCCDTKPNEIPIAKGVVPSARAVSNITLLSLKSNVFLLDTELMFPRSTFNPKIINMQTLIIILVCTT